MPQLHRDTLPRTITREDAGQADLVGWIRENLEEVRGILSESGAILFREFEGLGPSYLTAFVRAMGGEPMEYYDRAAHRTLVDSGAYTAADYPPSHELFVHNESSYATRWPMKLALHCVQPAETGGQTPIADVRRVLDRIDPTVRRRIAKRGVRYVRNFADGLFGPSWQTAFQTRDRGDVEAYCERSEIEFEWLDDNRLRTTQTRPAIARHPWTGDPVWFNHAAALHVSTLAERTRSLVMKHFSEEDLPSNTYYGDGASIEPDVLEEVRESYRAETALFDWMAGDVLLLDNMLVAHGRKPYSGRRSVVVTMSEPMEWGAVALSSTDG